jgi:ATP-dependent DNA helicase RecQ
VGRTRTPRPVGGSPDGADALDPVARAVFERLREVRRALAAAQGVPAYVVFHDRTLAAIATARPTTPDELRALPGIGAAKVERYGAAVLAALAGDGGTAA